MLHVDTLNLIYLEICARHPLLTKKRAKTNFPYQEILDVSRKQQKLNE